MEWRVVSEMSPEQRAVKHLHRGGMGTEDHQLMMPPPGSAPGSWVGRVCGLEGEPESTGQGSCLVSTLACHWIFWELPMGSWWFSRCGIVDGYSRPQESSGVETRVALCKFNSVHPANLLVEAGQMWYSSNMQMTYTVGYQSTHEFPEPWTAVLFIKRRQTQGGGRSSDSSG